MYKSLNELHFNIQTEGHMLYLVECSAYQPVFSFDIHTDLYTLFIPHITALQFSSYV